MTLSASPSLVARLWGLGERAIAGLEMLQPVAQLAARIYVGSALKLITRTRNQHQYAAIRQLAGHRFRLSYTHCFYNNPIITRGFTKQYRFECSGCCASQLQSGWRGPNKCILLFGQVYHPGFIAKYRAI